MRDEAGVIYSGLSSFLDINSFILQHCGELVLLQRSNCNNPRGRALQIEQE